MSVAPRVLRTERRNSGIPSAFWERVAKSVLSKAEEKWRAKGGELPFGGQHDNEFVLRWMMWADN